MKLDGHLSLIAAFLLVSQQQSSAFVLQPIKLCSNVDARGIPRPLQVSASSTVRSDRRSDGSSRASSATTTSSNSRQRIQKKKTFADRTQEETNELIQDIIQAAIDAGPQAGPARTFEAYMAFSDTFREFMPRVGRPAPVLSVPKVVRTLFEKLGATYIKLGQFIASSPTIFPKEYVLEFQKCLDKTDPMEWRVIKRVIEQELGPISNTFAYLDTEPLASASIAQVHAAKLKTGEDVVIKVQKPGIDASLKADLSFIYVASRVLEFLQPDWERTSLSGIVGDIRSSMLEELDFEKEATNTEEFGRFLAQNNLLNQATAPKVYRNYTTKKVFTMERLHGVSMLDEETISKVTKYPEMGQQAIISALNIWTASVMKMPWFHADVHAGNLLLLNDGRIGFIDFGIVGRVSPKTFKAVNELSTALALGDYRGMAQAMCNMGATDETVDIDKFGRDIELVVNRIMSVQPDVTIVQMQDGSLGGSLDVDESEITNLLLELVDITEENGLKLPREFGLLVKQSLYFDRYIKILAPELDVMNDTRVSGIGEGTPATTMNNSDDARSSQKELVIDV
ncbi:ABC1 family-domain containing protein [Nitzschia inconspicua]|uniref:ABC1 family-domain containing protein n=1 Tax=Nitzschia inconspicua TaxID=303405 RepID=A0A9K3L2R1_9STRA|nr:ABC1 family-domain containing protein [Nitzschia inconspicua]